MLHQGELDAIIVSMPINTSHLTMYPLFNEPFYAVFNKEDPLQKQPVIHKEDLYDKNVLLLEEGHCLREQVLDVCFTEKRRSRNEDFSLSSLETLYYIIAAEGGVSLFPALAIKMRQENPHIIVREFASPVPAKIDSDRRKVMCGNLPFEFQLPEIVTCCSTSSAERPAHCVMTVT